jgi:hypothetical protein
MDILEIESCSPFSPQKTAGSHKEIFLDQALNWLATKIAFRDYVNDEPQKHG